MCLVVFAWQIDERWPLVFAANRDERHARPTLEAAWWSDEPNVFGGRDLLANGGWLAVDRAGRLAAVTNVREARAQPAPRSRGRLVADYLARSRPLDAELEHVGARAAEYGPFNLLLFDGFELAYASNRAGGARFPRGIHALGNAPLGADWPKLRRAREGMRAALADPDPTAALFALLARREPYAEHEARYESALFIDGAVYGTRSSTVILVDAAGELKFTERSFDAQARQTGEITERFALASAARETGLKA